MNFKRKGVIFLSSFILALMFILSSVSVFAADSDTWVTKTPMTDGRVFFQTAVVDGKIYAIGGKGNGILNSVEEYDPTTNKWTTKASMSTPREEHQVAVLNGKIYAIG
ncbi:MAG TPA: kelch repeat-containing protein, partial [Ruminiclostridium sp.]|nr:kelch repeat-containing protein [Ruminiclostridium sp.]